MTTIWIAVELNEDGEITTVLGAFRDEENARKYSQTHKCWIHSVEILD